MTELDNEPIGGAVIGCACCLNTGPRKPATRVVRNIACCDEHAPLVEIFEGSELAALFRAARDGR